MEVNNIDNIEKNYLNDGFSKVTLKEFHEITKARKELKDYLQIIKKNKNISLENYHDYISEDEHEEIQWKLTQFFWKQNICKRIANEQIKFFRSFVGPDLYVQEKPFLRIARPNKETDNIGYHKDTHYGQSNFELAVHVPFCDLDKKSCLRFLPKSHLKNEKDFISAKDITSTVEKGSRKHSMGYPYAPKIPEKGIDKLKPIPIKVGEFMVFPPATMHGQSINNGSSTRFSCDFRIVNTFAPIEIKKGLESRGYVELSVSAISEVSLLYNKANFN